MEKPKIVSVTDALESPDGDDVPQLPGFMPSAPVSDPSVVPPQTDATASKPVVFSQPEFEEHPEEVPPERITPTFAQSASVPSKTVVEPSSSVPIFSPEPSATLSESSSVSSNPAAEVQQNKPTPSGVPPWVERNPPQPTVAEMAGPIPTYPGVGRPRINSISQGVVSLEPAKPLTAPIRPNAPAPASSRSSAPSASVQPNVSSAPARPATSAVLVPASSGKLYERPELDADHFAADMASHKPASTASMSSGVVASPLASAPASTVVQEYRKTASADLKPVAPARPRTPEEERAHAKSLAAQIHQDNQKAGFLGQIKRMFGLR